MLELKVLVELRLGRDTERNQIIFCGLQVFFNNCWLLSLLLSMLYFILYFPIAQYFNFLFCSKFQFKDRLWQFGPPKRKIKIFCISMYILLKVFSYLFYIYLSLHFG